MFKDTEFSFANNSQMGLQPPQNWYGYDEISYSGNDNYDVNIDKSLLIYLLIYSVAIYLAIPIFHTIRRYTALT
jgi:hypothetical protein